MTEITKTSAPERFITPCELPTAHERASALASVRRWGGVLEHPAVTIAWRTFGLPRPDSSGGWQRCLDGGWVAHVEQRHYGHRARKATWLYAVGIEPPALRWGVAHRLRRG
jgi:hypothetical protein